MSRTLFIFIFFKSLRFFVLIFGSVLLLIVMIDSLELLRMGFVTVLDGFWPVVWLAIRRTIVILQTVLPFIMLLTTIFVMIDLNRSQELVVMRAAGLSVWQFLQPLCLSAIVCGLFAAFIINPVAALSNRSAEADFAKIHGEKQNIVSNQTEIAWTRQKSGDDTLFLGAKANMLDGQFLTGVTFLLLDKNRNVKMRAKASQAVWNDKTWFFKDVLVLKSGEGQQSRASMRLPTNLEKDTLNARSVNPELLSVFELDAAAHRAGLAGINPAPFIQTFHANLAKPLFFLCMVVIASTICLRFGRFSRYDFMVLGGMMGGFLLYIFVEIFDGLGASGALLPYAAVWVPLIVVILMAVTVLFYYEDG